MNLKDIIKRSFTTSEGNGMLFKTGLTNYRQVSRMSPLPASDAMAKPDEQRYYQSNAGTAIQIPVWATLVRITAKGSELWYDFDGSGATLAVPSANIATGAPDWISYPGTTVVACEGLTQMRVRATGDFIVAFWGDV